MHCAMNWTRPLLLEYDLLRNYYLRPEPKPHHKDPENSALARESRDNSGMYSTADHAHIQADGLLTPLAMPDLSSTVLKRCIEPQAQTISAWDGPLFLAALLTFCLFISLALLSPSTYEVNPTARIFKVHIETLKTKTPKGKQHVEKNALISPSIDQQPDESRNAILPTTASGHTQIKQVDEVLEGSIEKVEERQHKDRPPQKRKPLNRSTLDYDLLESIIKNDNYLSSPSDHIGSNIDRSNNIGDDVNKDRNTGPHNTVFDNQLRQYLHSEELRQFNRRRESIDIGNYSDSTAEHFSDGNGNCFRIIDNIGETMWVPKKCPKKHQRKTEFGRLIN